MKNEYELYLENRNNPKKINALKTAVIMSVMMIIAVGSVGAIMVNTDNAYEWVYGYTTTTSFTTDTVQTRLLTIFNEDRSTYGVSPATLNYDLSNRSYYRAIDVRDYGVGEDPYYSRESIFIVNKEDFGRSYYNSPGQFVDVWRNIVPRFRTNELNQGYKNVGIGVAEGFGNYYIVVRWE